eukprot:6212486-Pleurochrysis_carterae.AAC.1
MAMRGRHHNAIRALLAGAIVVVGFRLEIDAAAVGAAHDEATTIVDFRRWHVVIRARVGAAAHRVHTGGLRFHSRLAPKVRSSLVCASDEQARFRDVDVSVRQIVRGAAVPASGDWKVAAERVCQRCGRVVVES